jgi:TPR repeat protein
MFKWLKRAAELGHSGSAFYVGSAYAGNTKVFGNQSPGVEVNPKDAELWLQKAAKSGGMGAILELASMYMEGRVIERNMPQAIHWYTQAAEKRNTFAMRKLGEIYERGIDIPPDPQEAMKWYKQAAGVPR